MSEHDDWAEINRLEAENARLRAELAAEREKVERLASSADEANVLVNKLFAERDAVAARLENALKEGAQRRAERDELRALLREVRKWKVSGDAELAARIDATLNKGVGDE